MGTEHTERSPELLRGYRVLSDEEKAMVDQIKLAEREIGRLWAKVYWSYSTGTDAGYYSAHARDLFRVAFMELVRTVTKPADYYREAVSELAEQARLDEQARAKRTKEADHG